MMYVKTNQLWCSEVCCAAAYFSRHALYCRYYKSCNLHESYDSRPLLYSKIESKYQHLDYWTM
jgi:hypothetical protein